MANTLEFVSFPGDNAATEWEAVRDIRWEVFVQEQHVPLVLEIDGRDYRNSTTHWVMFQNGDAVAVLRVLMDGEHTYHLGRVAVLRRVRGLGLGKSMVKEALAAIAKEIPSEVEAKVTLDAQVNAATFYQKLGFDFTAREPFVDAGIEHREMELVVMNRPCL